MEHQMIFQEVQLLTQEVEVEEVITQLLDPEDLVVEEEEDNYLVLKHLE